jgi:hypothetical protein
VKTLKSQQAGELFSLLPFFHTGWTGSCHRASLIHPILEPHLTVLHRFLTRPVAAPEAVQA